MGAAVLVLPLDCIFGEAVSEYVSFGMITISN